MKTTIRMDASTKYFMDDVNQIERAHLRGRSSSYAHKCDANRDIETMQNRSVKVYVALRRDRFSAT